MNSSRQFALALVLLVPTALYSGVVSDHFTLQWEVDDTNLLLAIDTDLPDTAEIMISVGRLYYEVGNEAAYSREYFANKGTVSEWRNPRRVLINDEAWKADLKAHQEKMAKLGSFMAFEIDRIEDRVQVNAVVHMNQPDSRFGGRGNPNLSGRAVSRSGKRNLIEEEASIEWPLSGAPVSKRSKSVAFDGLRKGKSYHLLKETPLMAMHPSGFESSDGFNERMEILGKTLYMPAGQVFRVVRVVSPEEGDTTWPWYEAETIGNVTAKGWINSSALMSTGVERE